MGPRKRKPKRDLAIVGVNVLRREVEKLDRRVSRLEGRRKRIGFQATSVLGDREEQGDLDEDYTPDEVP